MKTYRVSVRLLGSTITEANSEEEARIKTKEAMEDYHETIDGEIVDVGTCEIIGSAAQ